MSQHSDALRASVFVASEEAHLELIKLRDHTRLLARMSDPNAVTLHECPMHPRALALSYSTISRALDDYLQATHWSDDPSLDFEEAHARAAEIRERNSALCGCDAI
jgi:hypothetical protein